MCLKLSSLFRKVCCWMYGVRLGCGCGLGWFVGSKFSLCDGLGWISPLVGWVGLKKLDPRTTLVCIRRASTGGLMAYFSIGDPAYPCFHEPELVWFSSRRHIELNHAPHRCGEKPGKSDWEFL